MPVRSKADVAGWFFTEKADEVFYYYLALLNEESELNLIYTRYVNLVSSSQSPVGVENELLRHLKVDRDLLISFGLNETGTSLPQPRRFEDSPQPRIQPILP